MELIARFPLSTVLPKLKVDFSHYLRDEKYFIQPALEDRGYKVCSIVDGKIDKYGPLYREIVCFGPDRKMKILRWGLNDSQRAQTVEMLNSAKD